MNTSSLMKFLSLAVLSCGLIQAAPFINNSGFELGTFTKSSAVSFAGGLSLFPNSKVNTPANWSFAGDNVNWERWVQSDAALEGNHYFYIKGFSNPPGGKDNCLEFTITGLEVGTTYILSAYAATAQSTGNGIAVLEFNETVYQPFTLAANPAWSDTAKSVIPWQKVNFQFEATAATQVAYISAQGTGVNFATPTAVAFDNLTITTASSVPEPHAVGLMAIGLGALVGLRRRK